MAKLTKRVVDAAATKPDRYINWDTEIRGFGMLVMPSGIKSYFYQYRTAEGRQRRATIGKHGEWTPTQARAKAEDFREAVRGGRDPLADKRALKEAPAVGEILDAYLASESFKDKESSTQAIDRGRIERHLRPLLGRKHAHSLSVEDIKRAFNAIREGKTATDLKTRKRGRARWRHVDLKQSRLLLPPQSHKTGRKTGKPREIMLPAAAHPIIARQPEGSPDDFVFASARGDGAVALSKAWRKVRKEADLPPSLGLHGLRHSVASHLAMGGAQAPEIMTAMGHRQLSTVQR